MKKKVKKTKKTKKSTKKGLQVKGYKISEKTLKSVDEFVESVNSPEKMANFFNSFSASKKKGKARRDDLCLLTKEGAFFAHQKWYWEWKYPHVPASSREWLVSDSFRAHIDFAVGLETVREKLPDSMGIFLLKKDGSDFKADDFRGLLAVETLANQAAPTKDAAKAAVKKTETKTVKATAKKTTAKKSTKATAKKVANKAAK